MWRSPGLRQAKQNISEKWGRESLHGKIRLSCRDIPPLGLVSRIREMSTLTPTPRERTHTRGKADARYEGIITGKFVVSSKFCHNGILLPLVRHELSYLFSKIFSGASRCLVSRGHHVSGFMVSLRGRVSPIGDQNAGR